MTKDIQAAILRACARFIGKKIDPVEKRIGRLEEKSASWLEKEHADFIIDNLTEEGRKKWVGIIPRGEKGERGDPGKDADPVSISEVVAEILKSNALEPLIDLMVEERVVKYLTENPPPSGQPGKDGAPGMDGEKGESGKDGAGIADLLIDREGNLVATMTDGRVKSLGVVLGRDGAPGRDGKDGADFSKAEIDWEGERTLVIRGEGGEIRKTISVPMDKGYYREGMACEKADVVTHDGNAWIALRDTKAKPCHENKEDWRLFARKGRDGRDGKDGKPPPGPVRLTND